MSLSKKTAALTLSILIIFSLLVRCEGRRHKDKVEQLKNDYNTSLRSRGFKPSDLEVIAIGQSHIDAAWLWRWTKTRDYKCPATFREAISHFSEFPSYTYSQSSPQYYEWVKDTKPELFKQIVDWEKQGRWILVGGMWVEPDCNMPEGESFARQFLYGQRFFLANFGHITKVAWLPDSFGYNWNLPQFAARAGQKYMWTSKPTWNSHNIFPFHLFYWQAPDGSKLLTNITRPVSQMKYFPLKEISGYERNDYFIAPVNAVGKRYNTGQFKQTRLLLKPGEKLVANYLTSPEEIVSKLSRDFMGVVGVFFGRGDGGHGPVKSEIELQQAMQDLGYAKMGTADQLFKAFEKYSERTPVWNDEIYFEFHQGVMTTHEWIKRQNRGAESILRTAESAASAAFLLGGKYPMAELVKAWKLALLNQFHDILPGSSIPEVYQDSKVQYEQIQETARKTITDSLEFLADKISSAPPAPGMEPVLVYNPLGWERSDVVKLEVKPGEQYQVFTRDGKELASQEAGSEDGKNYLYFIPDSIPSLGWKVFYLKPGETSSVSGPFVDESSGRITIDNGLVSVAVDKKTGLLVSLYDKRLKKEFIKRPSNKLLAYKDQPLKYSAWNIADDYSQHPLEVPAPDSVRLVAQGPVFAQILVERSEKGTKSEPTSFKQWLLVYSGSPLVEMVTFTEMHWKETLVKTEFNTTIDTDKVAADIPYAVIERSTHPKIEWDKARTEMPVQKWTDLSGKDAGIALINFGKYGFSLNEDGAGWRQSIVKNAIYPKPLGDEPLYDKSVHDFYQAAFNLNTDDGGHWASMALFPHKAGWAEGRVNKAAYEYNTPAVAQRVRPGKGDLPSEASLLSLDSPSAYIASVKKAEDDDCLVVRVVEGGGKDTFATLKAHPKFKIEEAQETNLLELEPRPVKHDDKSATFPVGHFEIKTIKLKLIAK